MKLLFVAADKMEFPGIVQHAASVRREQFGVDWARSATLGSHSLLLVANGMGMQRAAAAVDAAMERFDAEAVISTGFCGALEPSLGIADIVVGTQVTTGRDSFTALNPSCGGAHHKGVVRSVDYVAQTARQKALLHGQGAIAVEMEAGGVAEKARSKGLKFYCIRVVTDLAGEDMANDFNKARRPDGHFATMTILRLALRDPLVRLPELIRLRNRCVRAARVLGDFIADCRF